MIALPTNKDENWRYANLRPLAKARVDDVRPPLGTVQLHAARDTAGVSALAIFGRTLRGIG